MARTKKLIAILLMAAGGWRLTTLTLPQPSLAQEATESSEVLPEVKEKIKERLEESVGESVEKVQGLIDDETSKRQKRAFFGKLKNVTTDTLLIEADDDVKQAGFSEETEFVKQPGNKKVNPEDLAVGDFVIAMGFLTENKVLESRRVVVTSEPEPTPERKLFWGKVKEVDDKNIVFNDHEISLSSEKILQIKAVEEPTVEDINLEDKIFVLAMVDEEGEIEEVKKVLVVPVKNGLEMETETEEETEESSPTAETSPSAE